MMQPNSDRTPQFQFRGTFVPAEIHYLLQEGKITTTEFVLLSVIDSLVDSRGEGCWASNTYLAERINKSEVYVRGMIKRLKDIGLLLVVQEGDGNTKRILETKWSRVSNNEGVLAGYTRGCSPASTPNVFKGLIVEQHSGPSRAGTDTEDSEGEDKMSPMFVVNKSAMDKQPTKQQEDVTAFDLSCSAKLIQGLQQAGRLIRKAQKTSTKLMYASVFTTLRKELDYDTDRIEEVLDWYTSHIGQPYVPVADSATSFREKFVRIEDAMHRDQEKNPQVVVCETVREIVERLRRRGWPKVTEQDILVATQLTYDRYNEFVEKMKELRRRRKDASQLTRFLVSLIGGPIPVVITGGNVIDGSKVVGKTLPNAAQFTEQWMLGVNERIANWENWNGDLSRLSFTPTSDRFQLTGHAWAESYCGRPELWDEVMKELNR